jgi:hypothetical protein
VEALSIRFVHVLVRKEAAAFLEGLKNHGDFVEKNMIAEHALWLNEQRWAAIVAKGHRFLVRGLNNMVSDVVATNSEVTSECCNAITRAITERRRVDWLALKDGHVRVSAVMLHRYLSLLPTMRDKSEREVVRAISSISERAVATRVLNGDVKKMWEVSQSALEAWCENTGVEDWVNVRVVLDEMAKAAE